MQYVFLVLSAVAAVWIGGANDWFSSWNALWQLPLTFAGVFLGFVVLFLLVIFISTRFISPKKLREKPSPFFRFLLNQFCRIAFFLGGVHVHITGMEKLPRDSRYLLVNVVAHRARQISIESELTHEPLPEKPVTMAIQEVARGELTATLKEKYMR